jgi:PIN domain nuclease of toxin-antitoxin system
LWEIALFIAANRLTLDREPTLWMRQSLARERVILLELSPEVAIASIRLGWDHRDPADRLIVATAIVHDARIVTKDRQIRSYRPARAIW